MEKFLKELKIALEEAHIENKEEILATYLEHFTLGHEAGMSDEEIIDRFDQIEDIIWKLGRKKSDKEPEGYSIELDLACFSDFQIRCSNKVTGIQFDIDEGALDYVEIVREGKRIHLKNKGIDFFSKRKKYDGNMLIGSEVLFNQFKINNLSCDVHCNFKINCTNFFISNVSGDIHFSDVEVEETSVINNTSGDITLARLLTPRVKINTISGDISISDFTCDVAKLVTVSGDIKIAQSNEADFQISSVSGDVNILVGADTSKVKASSVSGSIQMSGEMVGKALNTLFKDFKW